MHSNLIMRLSPLDRAFQTNDLIKQVLGISFNSCMPGAGHFWGCIQRKTSFTNVITALQFTGVLNGLRTYNSS